MTSRANQSWPSDHYAAEIDADAIQPSSLCLAAPEMLEALKAARDAYQQMFDVMPVAWQTFDNIIEAAIAKAEGCDFKAVR